MGAEPKFQEKYFMKQIGAQKPHDHLKMAILLSA
jgi:hypothetical protein